MAKENQNLWKGKFKEKELRLYGLKQKDIDIIFQYQKELPILQCEVGEEDSTTVNSRELYLQLGLDESNYSRWIKTMLLDNENFEENEDYTLLVFKEELNKKGNKAKDYQLTLSCAKELVMIVGNKPRTKSETKRLSKLTRKYFIAIEKAFKSRYGWNEDRMETIKKFHDLKEIIFADLFSDNNLGEYVPNWWTMRVKGKPNTYAYELHLLNEIIIGMSSRKYKKLHGIKSKIRNTFTEEQLTDVHVLEGKDAEYLLIDELWDTNKRMKKIEKFYKLYKEGKVS